MLIRQKSRLAQHFIKSKHLAKILVDKANLHESDIVIEIGAGTGILTEYLASSVDQVIAIELDPQLADGLRSRRWLRSNVQVICQDIRCYKTQMRTYRVFGNIPFNLTSQVFRWITESENPPSHADLIAQFEAFQRFAGKPRQTLISLLTLPRFSIHPLEYLNPDVFSPKPRANSVFFEIRKRPVPLVQPGNMDLYRKFITFGYRRWRRNLNPNPPKV